MDPGVLARSLVFGRLGPGAPGRAVFRLSRITGRVRSRTGGFTAPVPDVVTVRETVESWAGETATRSALIRLRSGCGYPLRARAVSSRELGDGWDELEIPYGHGLDAWLVEFGPDVVVLEPRICGPMSWTGCAPWPRFEGNSYTPWQPTPSIRPAGCSRW